ncbi:hypothetical protein [Steroidobacter sp.]|uniref:hypothetical protein n=1 Tax=Steroidobacter sp. TaxID=1978227 RepID=UPI001A626014|nr:hypothetical protein [Steroidobacter sp.]MBL8271438.1 hypothetical protein [Steroidobacter sp.]
MLRRIGIVTLVAVLLAPLQFACASSDAALDSYLQHIAASLPEKVAATLKEIDGTPRRLLAARAYLRAGDELRSRWSWSTDDIQAHARSPEYRALLEETERVRARFEAQNPGYTLYANTEARSLELQVTRFNSNKSVAKVAASLHQQALAEIGKPGYGSPERAASVQRFKQFLTEWRPPTAAPLAAPGISRHGQLRAIDFQIMKGKAIVAPTETATVKRNWDTPGWTKKLQTAMAGSNFRGPLESPYEPWHYEYDP